MLTSYQFVDGFTLSMAILRSQPIVALTGGVGIVKQSEYEASFAAIVLNTHPGKSQFGR